MASRARRALGSAVIPIALIMTMVGLVGLLRPSSWSPEAAGLMLVGMALVYYKLVLGHSAPRDRE